MSFDVWTVAMLGLMRMHCISSSRKALIAYKHQQNTVNKQLSSVAVIVKSVISINVLPISML